MEIELARLFVKVVQNGGFSAAAKVLKMPKSTLSKAISRLEFESGTKLLLRTTRTQTLTAAGKLFYESCLGPVQAIEDARKFLAANETEIAGLVRITAPEDLGKSVIAQAVAKLSREYPKLDFELYYSDAIVDLVRDGFDFAVRIGTPETSSLKIRRLGEVRLVTVASPSFLKGHEKIRHPKELESLPCLTITSSSVGSRWQMKSKGASAQIKIQTRVSCNQTTTLLELASAGAGIALVPIFLAQKAIADGKVMRVLPDWTSSGLPVSLLSTLAPSSSPRLKIVADSIQAGVEEALS